MWSMLLNAYLSINFTRYFVWLLQRKYKLQSCSFFILDLSLDWMSPPTDYSGVHSHWSFWSPLPLTILEHPPTDHSGAPSHWPFWNPLPSFSCVRVAQSFVFCVVLCLPLFVFLTFFSWLLYNLFFELRLLNITLVYSNATSSCL